MLGGLRARLDDDPILVVPTFSDVEHSQRELAERGAVFGARVMRFDWLFREIAARAGFGGREASDFQRELIVEEAVRRAKLEVLADSAAQPGFVRAAARFVRELTRSMVEPARLTQALRAVGGRRAAPGLRGGGRGGLPRVPRRAGGRGPGRPGAVRVAGARRAPRGTGAWGETPLFVYGFDDFTPLELRRARHDRELVRGGCDGLAAVRARTARRSRRSSGMHQELLALGAEELELAPLDDHYAPELARRAPPRRAAPVRGRAGRPRRPRARAIVVPLRRRRARRGRAGGGARAPAAARRRRAGRRGGRLPRPGALLVAARAGLRRLRHPLLDRPHAAASATPASGAACSR